MAALLDTILDVEGRCVGPGKSGEYGCFQYLPSTWAKYSKAVASIVLPHTAANERTVTEGMVRAWIAAGVSDRGIFLTWNQGTPGPDCYKGVNQWGVAYNSCEYAERALRILAAKEAVQ